MWTPLGKALRRLRIDKGMRLLTMAEDLGVSAAFLSAVEHGRKSPPADLVEKVIEKYQLTDTAGVELRHAATQSVGAIKVSLAGKGDASRELAQVFARNFGTLDEAEARRMLNMLRSVRENKVSDD